MDDSDASRAFLDARLAPKIDENEKNCLVLAPESVIEW